MHYDRLLGSLVLDAGTEGHLVHCTEEKTGAQEG